jgi:hypothetical protein
MVVRLPGNHSFALDLHNAFGLTSGAGCHGYLADAAAQLFRHHGIGPLTKFVDDHAFFRVPKKHLDTYNELRNEYAKVIADNGGARQTRSRIWYPGTYQPLCSRHTAPTYTL